MEPTGADKKGHQETQLVTCNLDEIPDLELGVGDTKVASNR